MKAINSGNSIKLNQNKNIPIDWYGPPKKLVMAVRAFNTAPVANTIRKVILNVSIS